MASAEQLSALNLAIESLWLRFNKVSSHIAWSWYPVDGTLASAKLALDVQRRTLHFLDDEGIARVQAGTYSYDAWKNLAQECYGNMNAVVGFTDKWNFTGFGSAVSKDIAGNVSAGLDVGAKYLPYVMLLAGLIALAIILGHGRAIATSVRG